MVALTSVVSIEQNYKGRIENLLAAAALHDIGRKNDKGDPKHGLRAAQWFKKNISMVEAKFKFRATSKDVQEIYWNIEFHELPLQTLMKRRIYNKFKNSVDILRMADALDRYRLPKIKWWINDEIIGRHVSERLKKTAFNFVVDSERSYLCGESSRQSILKKL